MGQTFTVRIEEEDSDPGVIGRGIRQGCPLSPLLFNIYIQEVLNETLDNGVATGGRLVQATRFADEHHNDGQFRRRFATNNGSIREDI